VAAPLMARSGVYRSTYDLVQAARADGHEWTAVIGMRSEALGTAPAQNDGVREVAIEKHGRGVVGEIEALLLASPEVRDADVVVTLITQSDLAMHNLGDRVAARWVAFVRGLPWPADDEQTFLRRRVFRLLETRALRSASAVWATTPVLAEQIASARAATIMPAGVPERPRHYFGDSPDAPVVWAGRIDVDKRPGLFVEAVAELGVPAVIYGSGPLEAGIRASLPATLRWGGWVDPESLWDDASIFVGTSSREAFGRSAVEAAMVGIPVIVTREYGAAQFLYTDGDLASRFVLPVDAPASRWAAAIRELRDDPGLRKRVSDHVAANARLLTIDASAKRIAAELAATGAPRDAAER
jgi:glycosyltransferase involved in cell wall biosynthesis